MAYDTQELRNWAGHDLVDSEGAKIGTIEEIYFDDETGQPEFLSVATGLFGKNVSFVPLAGTTGQGDVLVSRWSKAKVKDAPNVAPDNHLSPEEEEQLYAYYDMGGTYSGQTQTTETTQSTQRADAAGTVGRDTSGPTTDNAMTRSEEQLRVSKTKREAGTARLRKWVETEHESQQVQVAREEVRVEREPITDANVGAAMSGPEISEEEHEVTLMEEDVVADTEVVPKERVRLDKAVVTETETVGADVRKERIDIDADADIETRKR